MVFKETGNFNRVAGFFLAKKGNFVSTLLHGTSFADALPNITYYLTK